MKKTFIYKNLLALVVVLTLLITASATMLTTHASWGGFYPPGSGWGSTNSWEEQTVVVRFYDENDNVLTTANGAKATFGDSNRTEIDLCTSEHDEDGTWVGSGFSSFYVSNHNVSSSKNGKYLSENGLVVTPPPGYYVETVVLTCDHYHGEGCNTRAEGNLISFGNSSFESADYVITAEQFSEAQSDASLNEAVFHDGAQGGKSIHVTVYLAKCPSPAYIKYDAGNTGLFSYTGTATSGNPTGAARLNQDAYSYSYTQGIEDVPKAEVLAINPDLFKAAAAAGYKFTGWQLQYYTNANASATDVTLSGINGAASLIEATYNTDGTINAITDTVSMHLHAKLTAQWEKVPVYAYTVEYHLENLDGTYTTVRDIDYIAPAGQVIYSSAHLDEYTAPEGYVLNTEKTEVSDVVTSDNNMVLDIYYDRQDYKVTYYVTEPGASSPTKISENTYAFGAPIPSVTPDAVTGYTAYYWYETNTNNTSATKATVPELMPAKDLVYYGFYDANSYTVTYYFNGDKIGNVESYKKGENVVVRDFPTPPTGKYIEATAWGCDNAAAVDGNGNALVFTPASTFQMPKTNLSLYVESNGNVEYTVTWVLVNGGNSTILHTDKYTYNQPITERHLPTRENHSEVPEGYSAHGWYSDPALATPANIPHHVTTNLTFYAGLDKNDYKVFYHLDGKLLSTKTYEYGSTVTVAAKPVWDSHTVEGWYVSSDDPGVGNFGTPDYAENSKFTMPAKNVYLYAWSDIKLYNVRYYLDGVRLTPEQLNDVRDSYEHGEAVVAAELPTVTGYTVSGWFDKNGNAAVFPTAIESDLDYYATTDKAEFTVQYFIDDKPVSDKITFKYGDKVTADAFGKYTIAEGREIVGDSWTFNLVDPNAESVPIAAVKAGSGTFTMPASDVKLCAVTKNSVYKLNYWVVSENGTVTQYGKTVTYEYGHEVELLPIPKADHFAVYTGWYTTEACTEAHDHVFNMPAKDVNVYAHEAKNDYVVNYYIIKDGKTEHFSGPYDQHKDDIVTLIHVPVDSKGNYEYSAWVADLDSLEYKNSGKEFVMPGSNVNFYSTAKKLTTTYTIVYVDKDTGEEVDRDEKGGKIGETVVEEQPDVPGYEFADEKETKTIVLVEDEDQNVIIFYYEKEVTESEFRVEYKVYNPAYDTGNPDDDHYRYRTLDYYVEVADVGETVTARTRVFPGYTEIPGQNKSIVVSKNNNLIVVLYTDNTYDPTPDYFVQYFFNGVLDDSMTVHGEGNDGDVIKAEDFYLDDPTYTLVDVKPATEITLQIGTIGIINIYYEYEVIPVVPVIPVEPEEPSEPDTPVVPDEPDDKEDEEPFVPQQPDDPTPPNTSDVSYVYGIMAVMAALAAAGVLASKKILR